MWLKIKQEGQTAGLGPCFHSPGQPVLEFRFFEPQPNQTSSFTVPLQVCLSKMNHLLHVLIFIVGPVVRQGDKGIRKNGMEGVTSRIPFLIFHFPFRGMDRRNWDPPFFPGKGGAIKKASTVRGPERLPEGLGFEPLVLEGEWGFPLPNLQPTQTTRQGRADGGNIERFVTGCDTQESDGSK